MSKKITIRLDDKLFVQLKDECKRFGYRSLNAYICRLLKQEKVVEISYGNEIASVIHQIRTTLTDDLQLRERRARLCQLYDSLMTEIEQLRSYAELSIMQREEENYRNDI